MSAARYWHTLRYLRAGQIFGRLWFKVYQPAVQRGPTPVCRVANRAWRPQLWREPTMSGPHTLTLLNVSADVAAPDAWSDDARGKLWLYHLHYFDDLTSRRFEERREWHESLIDRWIGGNRAGGGAGWDPYPTSLRIVNWIKWLMTPAGSSRANDRMRDSLATQVRWLSRRLETHLMANHLWANAKALVAAGVFFDGPEAERWRHRGLEILAAEASEQILPDGGHFERSPMYHAIVLEDVLDLLQLAQVFPGVLPESFVAQLRSAAPRMVRWLRVMSHPDGQLSFFNDAAFGVGAPWAPLADYAEALGIAVDRGPLRPLEVLPESGYVRLQNDRATVLCDVAPIGPDYQPAHAHADTLSFELSIDGRRAVVNGGTSTYTAGRERSRQRSTAAHSTVEVDGLDSTDVWGGFRVGRRARPFDVKSNVSDGRVSAEAAHDGYQHRPGRVIHRRSWSLASSGLTVTDRVEGDHSRAVARFILHPDVSVNDGGIVRFQCDPAVAMTRVPETWHPEFGRVCDTTAVEVELTHPCVSTVIGWT